MDIKNEVKLLIAWLCIPFLFGLLILTNLSFGGWLGFFVAYSLAVSLAVGNYIVPRFVYKKSFKSAAIGILILIVLIPLVFAGTCGLAVGGSFIRSLFVR